MLDIKNQHYTQLDNLRNYFQQKSESTEMYKAITTLDTSRTPLKIKNKTYHLSENISGYQTNVAPK